LDPTRSLKRSFSEPTIHRPGDSIALRARDVPRGIEV
jgi:hypothetical protein